MTIPTAGAERNDEMSPTIAGYETMRRIGRGGAADVYEARRLDDGTLVAIKVLRRDVAAAVGADRFLREIGIMSRVRSAHLVPLLDSGEVGGLPWYVMPLAPGGALRDRITREGPLSTTDTIAVARDMTAALVALHAAGIVHRDVKPENVLLGAGTNEASLADYGVARALIAAGLEPVTSTGIVLGTPSYMSPEQGAGDAVGPRSDLYSLGCVMYEMLAGAAPFHAATAQGVIARHLNDPPPSLRAVRPELPAAVERLVMRLLAKSAADRPSTAAEVGAALAAIDPHGPPPDPSGTTDAAPGRRRAVALAAGLVVVAAAAVGIAARSSSGRSGSLDANRVVIYPFASAAGVTEEGEQLALLVGSALERSEPLRWLDGWSLLDATARGAGPRPLAADVAAVARRARARYYLTGTVQRAADSIRVVAELHDVDDEGATLRRTASGPASASAGRLALDAVVGLLPRLVGGGAAAEITRLGNRNPSAVAQWLQGERRYRESRMAESLVLFEEALGADASLAPAALRGAMAASWIGSDRAASLVQLALLHAGELSPRQRLLATALAHYLSGEADSTVVALRRAIEADSNSADSWTLAGETYRHLIPTITLDSALMRTVPVPPVWPVRALAAEAFQRALALDSTFTPPMRHLADDALLRGDVPEAARLVARLRSAGAPATTVLPLDIAVRCLRDGTAAVRWRDEVRADYRRAYDAGESLQGAPDARGRDCAKAAFSAVLDADTTAGEGDWGALVALVGLEIADANDRRAIALVDSAVTGGLVPASGLYVLLRAAGVDVGERDVRFTSVLMSGVEQRGTPALWLLTLGAVAHGDRATIERLSTMLDGRAHRTHERVDTLLAAAVRGWRALAVGDTAAAMRTFAALQPSATPNQLTGSLWESLAAERVELARLRLARGDARLAHRTASVLDHPAMGTFALFLRGSLEVRQRAAVMLGDSTLVRAAERRRPRASTSGAGVR